jgi:CheY-like chemotaxis protein
MATILVIDDEEPNRTALERIFAREGWSVATASDGRAGLDRRAGGGHQFVGQEGDPVQYV